MTYRLSAVAKPVVTRFNGRTWVNEIEGKGPFRGSYNSRQAAILVGRTHALDEELTHVVRDENGNVTEITHYEPDHLRRGVTTRR